MAVTIQYQGFVCSDVRVSRSRGITPDGGMFVEIPLVRGFPDGLTLEPPRSGQPLRLDAELPDPPPQGGEPIPFEPPTELKFVGTLRLIEGGFEPLEVRNLYVIEVQEIVREAEDKPQAQRKSKLRVVLADVRMFWGWGPIRDSQAEGIALRYSFNRLLPDGTFDLDSVDDDGRPFSVEDLLIRFVIGALEGEPGLERLPEREDGAWDQPADVDFSHRDVASLALLRIVQRYQTADPCFSWGGDLALYDDGEGGIGYDPQGGGVNSVPIPPQWFASKNLTGTSHRKAFGYPPPYAMVNGGTSIYTAAVDRWDFVLQINGRPWPLNDETLLRLTGDPEFTLEFLSRWILATDAQQAQARLPDRVARLLREQAWLIVRLPLVEEDSGPPSGVPFGPDPEGVPSPEGGADPASLFAPRPTRPGAYAHLLPLQAQGRLINDGKRAPIEVESYGFREKHHAWRNAVEFERLRVAKINLATAEEAVRRAAPLVLDQGNAPGVFGRISELVTSGLYKAGESQYLGRANLNDVWVITAQEGIDPGRVMGDLNLLRRIDRAKDVTDLGDLLEEAHLEVIKAQDEVAAFGDGRLPVRGELVWGIAKEILEFEKKLGETSLLDGGGRATTALARDPRNKPFRDRLSRRVGDLVRQAAQDRDRRRAEAAAGGGQALDRQQVVIVVNEGRTTDTRASILDAEAGLVRLGRRPGWVANPVTGRAELGPVKNLSNAQFGRTRFVPQPVRVTFGTTARPRRDAAYGSKQFQRPLPRPVTGVDPNLQASVAPDVIPQAATDADTQYVRHYKREGTAATQVAAENSGIGPVINRPDLVLLVDLDGKSNVGDLDARARDAAAAVFRRKEETEGKTATLMGPWPVNPDGVVASVQITTEKVGNAVTGFQTVVTTGGRDVNNSLPARSRARVRPRRVEQSEAVLRKGVQAK